MMSVDSDWAFRAVDAAYGDLAYDKGWTLLAAKWSTLQESDVALITLNPGGQEFHPPQVSEENGCGYVVQKWERHCRGSAPLQVQVQQLCVLAEVNPDELLAGYLIPFRSTNWKSLGAKNDALKFSTNLWRDLLKQHRLRLTFTISGLVFDRMREILGGGRVDSVCAVWGKTRIRFCDYPGGRLVGLPHLSRFRLFSGEKRQAREAQIRRAMLDPIR